MATKVADQGQGKSDCSNPDRKSKRSSLRGGRGKRCNFTSQITSGMEERKKITAITAPRMRGVKEREVVEEQEAAGRRREVPNKSTIIKAIKHACLHKPIE